MSAKADDRTPRVSPQENALNGDRFWQTNIDGSRFHKGQENADLSSLLVFVHGFRGDPVGTWGNLPKWLIDTLGQDLDVLSFRYESRIFHRASVPIAAEQLRRLIAEALASHMHIFFVVHSTGGLVVKEAIAQDLEVIESDQLQSHIPVIAGRTREIFNFAVPHRGTKRWVSLSLRVFAVLNRIMVYLTSIAQIIKGGFPSIGRNQLLIQLQSESDYTKSLANRFTWALQLLARSGLPRPTVTDFQADDDLVVEGDQELGEVVHAISNHELVKVPSSADDPRVHIVCNRIRPYVGNPSMGISYATIRRSRILDTDVALVRGENNGAKVSSNLLGAHILGDSMLADHAGSQLAVSKLLVDEIAAGSNTKIVVTGGAGVGKSVLLRTIARDLCIKHLESRGMSPICLLVPLQQMSFTSDELKRLEDGGQSGVYVVFDHWSSFAKLVVTDESEEQACTTTGLVNVAPWKCLCNLMGVPSLKQNVLSRNAIILFDGIDELLTNHSTLGIGFLVNLQQEIEVINSEIITIMGARSTLPNLSALAPSASTFEILPLSEDEAEQLFPGTSTLLSRLEDEELSQLILTPLILGRLGPVIKSLSLLELQSRISILRRALKALISTGGLLSFGAERISVDDWIDALSVLAWIFYKENQFVMRDDELIEHVHGLQSRWSAEAAPCPSTSRIVNAVSILLDPKSRRAIRLRTVLTGVGTDGIRFVHREWLDALVAHYVARVVHSRMGTELHFRAFNKQIYRDTSIILAELLSRQAEAISREWLVRMYGESFALANPIALMSLAAALGNGPVPIDRSCYRYLSAAAIEDSYPEVARLTVISSFSMRLLRRESTDLDWDHLLADSTNAMSAFARQGTSLGRRVSASMAWCYAKILGNRFNVNAGLDNLEWPVLDARTEEGIQIGLQSGCVWQTTMGGEASVSTQQKTFQIAAVHYAIAVRNAPDEEISLVHYLFLVCAALRAGHATGEVYPLLRAVFDSTSGIEDRVNSFQLGEVRKIFDSCYEVYKTFSS